MICYCVLEKPRRKPIHMPFQRNTKTKIVLFALAAMLPTAFSADAAWAIYPDRIVRIVVPLAPGGGTDLIARTLAQEMAKELGASVIIENRPGAGTIIGTQAVASSQPDGYTLLMGTFANAVNPSLNAKLPYDPHGDFAAVALIARSFNIVVVNPKSAFQSIADLIAAAKAEPDKLSYGTYGTGTSAACACPTSSDGCSIGISLMSVMKRVRGCDARRPNNARAYRRHASLEPSCRARLQSIAQRDARWGRRKLARRPARSGSTRSSMTAIGGMVAIEC
jgi:Tripartite tricarboxylate transporter family receptor